jgi:hypothetical protein
MVAAVLKIPVTVRVTAEEVLGALRVVPTKIAF